MPLSQKRSYSLSLFPKYIYIYFVYFFVHAIALRSFEAEDYSGSMIFAMIKQLNGQSCLGAFATYRGCSTIRR